MFCDAPYLRRLLVGRPDFCCCAGFPTPAARARASIRDCRRPKTCTKHKRGP